MASEVIATEVRSRRASSWGGDYPEKAVKKDSPEIEEARRSFLMRQREMNPSTADLMQRFQERRRREADLAGPSSIPAENEARREERFSRAVGIPGSSGGPESSAETTEGPASALELSTEAGMDAAGQASINTGERTAQAVNAPQIPASRVERQSLAANASEGPRHFQVEKITLKDLPLTIRGAGLLILKAVPEGARGVGQLISLVKNISKIILNTGQELEVHYTCIALSGMASSALQIMGMPKILVSAKNLLEHIDDKISRVAKEALDLLRDFTNLPSFLYAIKLIEISEKALSGLTLAGLALGILVDGFDAYNSWGEIHEAHVLQETTDDLIIHHRKEKYWRDWFDLVRKIASCVLNILAVVGLYMGWMGFLQAMLIPAVVATALAILSTVFKAISIEARMERKVGVDGVKACLKPPRLSSMSGARDGALENTYERAMGMLTDELRKMNEQMNRMSHFIAQKFPEFSIVVSQ